MRGFLGKKLPGVYSRISVRRLLLSRRTLPWLKPGRIRAYSLPAWRPAVWLLRFLLCKNLQLKNGTEAIFEQRKG
jgi:hypothetical protein